MKLTPVESSHIAAIGYLEDERVLLVRYKDGTLHARPGWESHRYEALMSSDSKGMFLNSFKGDSILIAKGVMPTEAGRPAIRGTVAGPGDNEAPSPGPLNVIDEDADKCCKRGFASMSAKSQQWESLAGVTCGECGQYFTPEMVGPNRYWRIVPQVHIVRKNLTVPAD